MRQRFEDVVGLPWRTGETESKQRAANLENSEGRWEGLSHSDQKRSFKGLEQEHSERKVIGKLTDCKVQPEGQVQ